MIKYLIKTVLAIALFSTQLYSAEPPYRPSLYTDGVLICSGSALLGFSFFSLKKVDPLTDSEIASLSKNDINKFDRPAANNWSHSGDKLSYAALAGAVVSPFILVSNDKIRNDLAVLGLMYAESVLITNGLNLTVKNIAQRKRPFTHNPDAPNKKKKKKDAVLSFYSGHTANAFNSAVFASTVFSEYYPQSQWHCAVWAATLLSASLTGYLRYYAGKHYPSDIIAGAIIGGITGWGIPALHKNSGRDVSFSFTVGDENMIAAEFYF